MMATQALANGRGHMFVKPRAAKRSVPRMCAAVYKVTFKMPTINRETTIECDSETYILDAVEASGTDLGFNCTAGGCANCAGKLLSGTVDQSDQAFLDEDQIANGLAMLCTSLPRSDCVIEIRRDLCCS